MVGKIKDYEFQTQCVEYLIDKTVETSSKQVITVKAPTGAGKTIILIKYVDEFLKNTSKNTAFVWLCPGKGNLEEQSKERMEQLAPHIDTRNLMYSMMVGFEPGSVTFINWELVTKKGNTALKDSERSNLFEKIAEAHKDGTEFVVIIDEEHLNNTKKADDVISAFAAKNIIRVSATANKVPHQEYYEISEEDVIAAGLITRAIYVNEGVDERKEILNDYEYLLDLADDKRKEIAEAYNRLEVNVRPLVLIQFPMGQPETIKAVEEKLASMGYTYDNGMVNIWMSDEKIVSDDLTKLDGSPAFLLMKQAISTGWDCPRAKILVKLREGGSEDFQIQTIGRIRRMPEGKHYGLNILDYCYIYTLDTQYKMGLLSALDKAYQVRRLFLRDEAKDFTLTKEMRDLDFDGLGERETLEKVYAYFKEKYHLGSDKKVNQENLEAGGYNFSHEIDNKILQGIFRTTEDLARSDSDDKIKIKTTVNTHTHGIYLLHSVDEIKKVIVVNVPLKTSDNVTHSTDREISFDKIDEVSKRKIAEYLIKECNVQTVDLSDCYYLYTSMDLFNPHDSLLGKTINFFVDVYGEEPKRAKVLFQTMTDTIEMKACYEQRCINYDEVILKKGISRNELQKILEKHIDISDESIQIVKQEIKEIYPEFSVCTKMNAALVAVTKELRTNKVLIKIEQSIVKYILGNLELFDGEIVDSILLLDNVYKKEFPVEYTFQERHSLYIMVIVRVREGYYA